MIIVLGGIKSVKYIFLAISHLRSPIEIGLIILLPPKDPVRSVPGVTAPQLVSGDFLPHHG